MRRVKHLLTYVLVLSICFTLFFFPVKVSADGATYITLDTTYTDIIKYKTSNVFSAASNYDVRCVYLLNQSQTNNRGWICFVTDASSRNVQVKYTVNGSVYNTNLNLSLSVNGNTYYYNYINFTGDSDVVNDIYIPYFTSTVSTLESDAINYTYGAGSVDPEPPGSTYGRVADVEYATRIAGSGLASADNIDRIVWNQSVDTNGNDLPTGARVQIRAIPGKYVGNTANDVLTKSYTDFVLDHSKQLIIVDIIASRGVYETKWSEVVDHFGFFPYSWVPNIQYLDNEYFKMGWIYQIRLQVEDYYSEWQNIYTATGSGASESQTITDSEELTQQLVQDINIVNQLNNTTTTNWYINETTINNSEYTENTNGKPWWAYLLEAILSLFQIGDDEQQTINNTNNLNIDLNDKLNEYNQIEDQQLNNLDTNLEAIEVESDMLENNKFVGSANWVAQQYTRITNGTVIGSLIGFSLLFGLALIFIGKIR